MEDYTGNRVNTNAVQNILLFQNEFSILKNTKLAFCINPKCYYLNKWVLKTDSLIYKIFYFL